MRANWAESILAVFGFAGIAAGLSKYDQLSGPLLAGLLLFPTLGMAAAPVNSWAARRATLRERRRTEYRRDRRSFAAGVATGGAVAVLGIAIAAIALLFTGHPAQTSNLVGPAQGTTSAPASPSSSPSTSPSTTTSPSASPSATLTPTSSPTSSPSASPTPSGSPSPATSPSY